MYKPLVTICIACFNAGKFIPDTIQSIVNQTYQNIEVIIVDDGSKDSSVEIILGLIEKYNKTKILLISQKNRGQCYAANTAFKHAQGEYIKFLDADDLISPDHIETQVLSLSGRVNSIAAGQVRRFYNDKIQSALREPLANWKNLSPIDWLLIDNGKGLGMMQCGMFLIPKPLLEKTGLWNENLSLINDFEFFPRVLLSADEIIFTETAEIFYRSGTQNSLSNVLNSPALLSAFTALSITTERILSIERSIRSHQVLGHFWSLWAYHFYSTETDLFNKANREIIRLTGKKFMPQYSGITGLLAKLLGWRFVKKIKDIKRTL
jgi:glycosyltransferase involved in cell wall biosynthesis